jgi:hypothetical protein
MYVRVPKHLFENRRVSFRRHLLNRIGEVPVIDSQNNGHTVDYGCIHLRYRHSPLLGRIMHKDIFENKITE